MEILHLMAAASSSGALNISKVLVGFLLAGPIISYGLDSIMKLTLPATKLLLHTAQRALEWILAKRLPVHQPRKALNSELLGSSTF